VKDIGTTDAIFLIRQLQKKFRVKGKKNYFVFVDLEKRSTKIAKHVI